EMRFVATDEVGGQGTPIAAVVAESAALAHDAAALVRVEWTPLPGAAEPDAALAPGAPPVVGRDDNRCFSFAVRAGEPARAFAAAHRTVAVDVRQARLAGGPRGPRGAGARWAGAPVTML